MNSISWLIITCALLGSCAGFGFAAEKEGYLAEKADRPKLKERLVLREEQLGFAGVSGKLWVVEPDGRWRIDEIQPAGTGKVQEKTLASGQLTPDEVVALADV